MKNNYYFFSKINTTENPDALTHIICFEYLKYLIMYLCGTKITRTTEFKGNNPDNILRNMNRQIFSISRAECRAPK